VYIRYSYNNLRNDLVLSIELLPQLNLGLFRPLNVIALLGDDIDQRLQALEREQKINALLGEIKARKGLTA